MEQELVVKLLDESSLVQQVEVYMQSFDIKESYDETIEYWNKKHYKNPIHSSYIFGVFDGDRLVSINAYMPMQYIFNKKVCNVIQSCESGTVPEYRGKGIWSKVVTFAVNYFKNENIYDFLIGFPNYENSYGGFIKMKWNHDVDVINYIMVGNGKNFIRSVINGKSIPFSNIFNLQHFFMSIYYNNKLTISDNVLNDNIYKSGFNVIDSKEFIEWKKNYKKINEFVIKDNVGDDIAVCRYFLGDYNRFEIAQLCNLKVLNNKYNLKSLYSNCIKEILRRHKEIAFIRTWTIKKTNDEKAYRGILFLKSKHHNPFITYQLKDDVISSDILHNYINWLNISFLDLD